MAREKERDDDEAAKKSRPKMEPPRKNRRSYRSLGETWKGGGSTKKIRFEGKKRETGLCLKKGNSVIILMTICYTV